MTVRSLSDRLRFLVQEELKRRGLVIGLSGGVDSSVCAALAVRALGPERVFALILPERDSDPTSEVLARRWAEALGIQYAVQNLAPTLEAVGCYRLRDEAIRQVVPQYDERWRCKLVVASHRSMGYVLGITYLVVQDPDGVTSTLRPPAAVYRQVVAATSFKQRVRKMVEYYHADLRHFAVAGTANRLEYDQGFFVKGGDGLADVKPIAHLYKSQVYQLAEYFQLPDEITSREPTTDTYPLPQSQAEFYFDVPLEKLDLILYSLDSGMSLDQIAAQLEVSRADVAWAARQIEQRRGTTRYLHLPPLLLGVTRAG